MSKQTKVLRVSEHVDEAVRKRAEEKGATVYDTADALIMRGLTLVQADVPSPVTTKDASKDLGAYIESLDAVRQYAAEKGVDLAEAAAVLIDIGARRRAAIAKDASKRAGRAPSGRTVRKGRKMGRARGKGEARATARA